MSSDPTHAGTRGPGIPGTVAVLLLAAFWLATLTGRDARSDAPPRRLEARLRRLFENNAPGIRALAVRMNGLLYLFGEQRGADTVFVASSGTRGRILLFTPEMQLERADPEDEALFARNVDAIRAQVAALREAGVARVLLVPVPTKLSVTLAVDPSVRSQVAGISPPSRAVRRSAAAYDGHATAEAYDRFVTAFRDAEGVDVVPLHRLLVARAMDPDQPVFSYEDTHWTSLGLNLAAAEVLRVWRGKQAESLKRIGQWPDDPGDLQRMLALPDRPWFRTHPMVEDVYELRAAPQSATCPGRVFLLGTSYSSHRGQTLAGLLSQASGCQVTDVSRWGEPAVVSLRALSEDYGAHLRDAVVIWELPFRDLVAPWAFRPKDR
jgi:hypothetical protein